MNDNRIVTAEFCDDIRHELGYKYSLMGCYSGELIADSIPCMLPKLCAAITVITPIEDPFKKLIIRAFLGESLIAENEIPEENLVKMSVIDSEKSAEFTKLLMKVQMFFTPLAIQENSVLRIEAETECGNLNGPKLIIRTRKETDLPALNY